MRNTTQRYILGMIFIVASLALVACSDDKGTGSGGNVDTGGFTLDADDLIQGCSGPDCIPSIDNPKFESVESVDWLVDDDLVAGMIIDGQPYAYPYAILNWHEIVNQKTSNGDPVTVSYCPLTSSTVAFYRNSAPDSPEFGVSGLLWRSNLIMYDRGGDHLWSQMALQVVSEELAGTPMRLIGTFEMTWRAWRKAHPNGHVLSRNTGHSRDYTRYPYRDYWTNDNFFIPQPFVNGSPAPPHYYDDRLDAKQRVHGVHAGGGTVAFRLDGLLLAETRVLNTFANGVPILLIRGDIDVHDPQLDIAHSLLRTVDSQVRTLEIDPATSGSDLPLLRDVDSGTRWTLTGQPVDGPLANSNLTPTDSHNAFWFAWQGFWPNTGLVEFSAN